MNIETDSEWNPYAIHEQEIESLRHLLSEKNAEIERLSGDFEIQQSQLGEMLEQLAASQAREQQLREALKDCYIEFFYVNQQLNAVLDEDGEPLYTEGKTVTSALANGKEALAIPQDTTALSAMIAKAGEVMRERCRKVAFDMAYSDSMAVDVSQKIRALHGVTLEDLKA